MNIEEYIQKEAPGDDAHDRAYATALRKAYNDFKDLDIETLQRRQAHFRSLPYNSEHVLTAQLVVLYELVKGNSV